MSFSLFKFHSYFFYSPVAQILTLYYLFISSRAKFRPFRSLPIPRSHLASTSNSTSSTTHPRDPISLTTTRFHSSNRNLTRSKCSPTYSTISVIFSTWTLPSLSTIKILPSLLSLREKMPWFRAFKDGRKST